MIQESDVKFRRLSEADFEVLYQGVLIGGICYTPESCSPWMFTSAPADCWTFGSTRLQAIRFYFDIFYHFPAVT